MRLGTFLGNRADSRPRSLPPADPWDWTLPLDPQTEPGRGVLDDHAEILLEIKAKIRFPEKMIELASTPPKFISNWHECNDPDCTPERTEKNLLSYMSQWPRGVKQREKIKTVPVF